MKTLLLGLAAAAFTTAAWAAEPAMTADTSLGKVLVGPNGMTLYKFDKDTQGAPASACTGKCIEAWPPFVADASAKAEGEWTIVDVTDKDGTAKKMWAYDGWPLYYWFKDTKPGDVTGDGVNKVWHVVKEGM